MKDFWKLPTYLKEEKYRIIRVAGIFALLAAILSGCGPQRELVSPLVSRALMPPKFGFFMADHPSLNSDSSEVSLFARIRHDDVIFVKTDSGFYAHYQLSIGIYADEALTDLKYSRFFDRRILVPTFMQTISGDAYDTLQDNLTLHAGRYYISLRLYDLNTNETASREMVHTFEDFSKGAVHVSDVLLYDRADTSGSPIELVSNRLDTIYAKFFIVANVLPADISLRIIARSTQAPTYIDTTYTLKQTTAVQRYRVPFTILSLSPAAYDLVLTATLGDKESSSATTLRIPRSPVPLVPAEMDEAIRPLEYIAGADVISELSHGTMEERQKKFKQFWLSRARGDPVTANALMNEFYSRVDYANLHFGSGILRGWQSDRGRIYIIYGPPDNVQNQEGGFNTPTYQIWDYYSSRTEFVFYDQFGTGDYRLIRTTEM